MPDREGCEALSFFSGISGFQVSMVLSFRDAMIPRFRDSWTYRTLSGGLRAVLCQTERGAKHSPFFWYFMIFRFPGFFDSEIL